MNKFVYNIKRKAQSNKTVLALLAIVAMIGVHVDAATPTIQEGLDQRVSNMGSQVTDAQHHLEQDVEMIAVKLYNPGGADLGTVTMPKNITVENVASIIFKQLNKELLTELSIPSQPDQLSRAKALALSQPYSPQSVLVPIIAGSSAKALMFLQDRQCVDISCYILDGTVANHKFESNSLSVKQGSLNELNELIRIKLPEDTSHSENVEVILTVEKTKLNRYYYCNTLNLLFFKIAEETATDLGDLGFHDNNSGFHHNRMMKASGKYRCGWFHLAIWSRYGTVWQNYDRYSVSCSTEMHTHNIDIPSGSDISQYMEQSFKDLAKRLCYDDETEYNIQIDSKTKVITLTAKGGCILIQGDFCPGTESYKVSFTRDCLIGSAYKIADRISKKLQEKLQEQETVSTSSQSQPISSPRV